MIKVKEFSLPRFGLMILLVWFAAYMVSVVPKSMELRNSSTFVFEDSAVEVTSLAQPKVIPVEKKAPQAAPVSFPIVPPKVLYRAFPAYPAQARRSGIEGIIVVKALIDENGKLSQTAIKTSSGSGLLDEAAVACVSKWEFSPAKRGVQSIRSWLEIPFKFALK